MLSILIAAAVALPPPVPEPQHLRRNEYGYVVDTPGDPALMTFSFTARPRSDYIPLELGIQRMMEDEPYEIVSADLGTGRVVLRTTDWGGLNISETADLIVSDVSPDIDRIERVCSDVMAHLTRDDANSANDTVWGDAPCPPAEPVEGGRALIVVGWNERGEQLWVTTADDPRDVEWETFDADGPTGRHSRHDSTAPVWATLRIPVTEDLRSLVWFEVSPENTLGVLGISEWRPMQEETDGEDASNGALFSTER